MKAGPGAPREPLGRAAGGKEGRPAEPGLGGRRGRRGRRSPTQRRAAAPESAGGVRSLPRPRRPRAVLEGRGAAVSGSEKRPAGSREERGGPPASAGAAGGRRRATFGCAGKRGQEKSAGGGGDRRGGEAASGARCLKAFVAVPERGLASSRQGRRPKALRA